MHSDRTTAALIDIRHNIRSVRRFTDGVSLEEFEKSEMHFYAVTRALEIISEASRRLPSEMRNKHAGLPWRQIAGAGNFYRHEYGGVLPARVWATVQEDLQALEAFVEEELGAEP